MKIHLFEAGTLSWPAICCIWAPPDSNHSLCRPNEALRTAHELGHSSRGGAESWNCVSGGLGRKQDGGSMLAATGHFAILCDPLPFHALWGGKIVQLYLTHTDRFVCLSLTLWKFDCLCGSVHEELEKKLWAQNRRKDSVFMRPSCQSCSHRSQDTSQRFVKTKKRHKCSYEHIT